MDLLESLRLQWAWGADEALLDAPQNRFAAPAESMKHESMKADPAKPEPMRVESVRAESAKILPAISRPPPRPLAAGLPPGPAEAAKIAAACESLAALRAALQDFTGCALRDTATQLVFADGAEDARLILVGEAPGADEDRVGRPFVGAAGQLLDRMLASIRLDRGQVRIVNVVPWRPPGNRAPTESEIAVCLPFLQRHIALMRPACLLLLGAVAGKALLPEAFRGAGIRRLRGQWRSLAVPGLDAEIPCLPTYHPAYLLRTPAAKRESWHDLIAMRQWLNEMENRS